MDMADIVELCCAARACMQLYRKASKLKRSERYFGGEKLSSIC